MVGVEDDEDVSDVQDDVPRAPWAMESASMHNEVGRTSLGRPSALHPLFLSSCHISSPFALVSLHPSTIFRTWVVRTARTL